MLATERLETEQAIVWISAFHCKVFQLKKKFQCTFSETKIVNRMSKTRTLHMNWFNLKQINE